MREGRVREASKSPFPLFMVCIVLALLAIILFVGGGNESDAAFTTRTNTDAGCVLVGPVDKQAVVGDTFLVRAGLTPGKCKLASFATGPEPAVSARKTVVVDPSERISIKLKGPDGIKVSPLNPETQRPSTQLSTHWVWQVGASSVGDKSVYVTVTSLGPSGTVTATNNAIVVHVTVRNSFSGDVHGILTWLGLAGIGWITGITAFVLALVQLIQITRARRKARHSSQEAPASH